MPDGRRESFADLVRSGEARIPPGGSPGPAGPGGSGRAEADFSGSEFFALQPDDEGGEAEFFAMGEHRKDGANPRRLRDIARGRTRIEDEIDLHGWTAAEAHGRLEDFLRRALADGARVVEVVHGRGLRAEDGKGVLRAKTRKWLARCEMVLGFVEPRNNAGAVRVLLRRGGRDRPGGRGRTAGRGGWE